MSKITKKIVILIISLTSLNTQVIEELCVNEDNIGGYNQYFYKNNIKIDDQFRTDSEVKLADFINEASFITEQKNFGKVYKVFYRKDSKNFYNVLIREKTPWMNAYELAKEIEIQQKIYKIPEEEADDRFGDFEACFFLNDASKVFIIQKLLAVNEGLSPDEIKDKLNVIDKELKKDQYVSNDII